LINEVAGRTNLLAIKAMQTVLAGFEHSGADSGKAPIGMAEPGHDAETRHGATLRFLQSMAGAGEEDRRRYERIVGGNAEAVLCVAGRPVQRGIIVDISHSGVSLRTAWPGGVGTEVMIKLPGTDGPVNARMMRNEHGVLALMFHQNEETERRVDAAVARVDTLIAAAAA
jgi:hypothetical protein